MALLEIKDKAHWSGRFTFILSAVGAAVGLGNIWRFPYIAGEQGGGVFIILYLIFVFAIGVPALMAEISLGRWGGANAVDSYKVIAESQKKSKKWGIAGGFGVFGATMIMFFYSVVGGWVLHYLYLAITGGLADLSGDMVEKAAQVKDIWEGFSTNIGQNIWWHVVFMAMTAVILFRGLKKGIEKANLILLPTLFVLLFFIALYSMITADFSQAFSFMFSFRFEDVSGGTVIAALGQALFSLSVGACMIMTYSSYLEGRDDVTKNAITIASADTLVAIISGLAIFPIVFASGLSPEAGPALIFQTLPQAFSEMPAGGLIAVAFFVLIAVAALTSSISILEPLVMLLQEKFNLTRIKAVLVPVTISFVAGLTAIFWGDLFNLYSNLVDKLFQPIGVLLVAIFCGWFVGKTAMQEAIGCNDIQFAFLDTLLKFIVPVAIVVILIAGFAS